MSARPQKPGYSSDVQMELIVNGYVLSIGQLGPNFIILDHPAEHPPSEAIISMSIDGKEDRWPVQLPDGITPGKVETRISRCW